MSAQIRTLAACLLAVSFAVALPSAAMAQSQTTAAVAPLPLNPDHDTNALFLDRQGNPVYLVANLQFVQFLGADVLFGNFTDGESTVAWYLTPSFSKNQYFWVAANGPVGVIRIRPDAEPPLRWKDNQGNKGFVITF